MRADVAPVPMATVAQWRAQVGDSMSLTAAARGSPMRAYFTRTFRRMIGATLGSVCNTARKAREGSKRVQTGREQRRRLEA